MDLRRTFDREALLYDRARPHYPAELFDKLIEVTSIKPDDALLEIGPGTGQATEPLAEKGYRITAIELGEHLAVVARHKLRSYPNVTITTGSFEKTELPANAFELIYSATAFHWIKPEVKFIKSHELLTQHGHLAIIHTNHVSDEEGDAYHEASQAIYEQYWPPNPLHHLPVPHDLKPPEIDDRLFESIYFHGFPLTIRYSSQQYADILGTYSPTLALPEPQRQEFLSQIKQLIDEQFGGNHTKHFIMTLAIARAR